MTINTDSIFAIQAQCSEQIGEWLNHQASLTDKLKAQKGNAQLEVIFQNWVNTDWWSKYFLKIQDETVFQREIIMKSNQVAYWYARSIIPQKCYHLNPSFFDRLKNESIKNLLFGEEQIERCEGIYYPINEQCIEFHWVKKRIDSVDGVLWLRLTDYIFQQKESLYLVEIMLPQIETLIS